MSKKNNQLNKSSRSKSQPSVQVAAQQSTTISGPLPSAEEMAKYNAINPELVILRAVTVADFIVNLFLSRARR